MDIFMQLDTFLILDFAPNIDVKLGLYDAIKIMCPSAAERRIIDKQIDLFTSARGMFGHDMAKETRERKHPALWWNSYGDSTPELKRVYVRILSATCSASGYERNWRIFEQMKGSQRLRNEEILMIQYACQTWNQMMRGSLRKMMLLCKQILRTWMDMQDCFQITEAQANKKKRKRGLRNLSTMKLALGKGNNKGKESRLVEENEIEEVEEDEIEEETYVEEMSEDEIEEESDNEWFYDDGYDMGDQ